MDKTEDKAWLEYRDRFANIYDDANYSSSLQSFVMGASHSLTEKPYTDKDHFSRVLEIGAGTGEHLKYVRHSYDNYILSDHDASALEVAKKKLSSSSFSGLSYDLQSGGDLRYADDSFDRVIAVHVLEHIYYPHIAIKEWARVIKAGGVLSVLIPTDPGIAWRVGRHLGPRRNAIAQGIAYDYVMAREHVNSCVNLVALLKHYFPNHKQAWWPLKFSSVDMNLFYAFHARVGV